MEVNGHPYRAVWMEEGLLCMIDQRVLPFSFEVFRCSDYRLSCEAIRNMTVRGAGTIGATAGYAMAQAAMEADITPEGFTRARREIEACRPTARDLFYATERVYHAAAGLLAAGKLEEAARLASEAATEIADNYVAHAYQIGAHGSQLISDGSNILTHCNAGWLALVDHGSALSPVFMAHREGKKIHVWVDETRPRNQGAKLTAWELSRAGIPHTIIADNAAAWMMARGQVDLLITGADRIAANGDVANKIGTLEKAIAAKAFNLPFYVAAPLSTFDRNCPDGYSIPVEERDPEELTSMNGINLQGTSQEFRTANPGSAAYNPAFDITQAKYVTAYICESGVHNSISGLHKRITAEKSEETGM
ncbi:MAG TPA: S-methyl-5-thioribose-1-phosphate isomerase [Bacteroidales bacterium]|nr:S-methyl-5-thioribose-1-phosphate isomerase [Bacteroidales bacterium]HSA42971.1 S-methyl-5-thioribose-1-phosphate isomerase [Bacteroidales bacterium]